MVRAMTPLGRPAQVDLSALLAAALPAGVTVEGAREMTLDGSVRGDARREAASQLKMAGLRRQGVAPACQYPIDQINTNESSW